MVILSEGDKEKLLQRQNEELILPRSADPRVLKTTDMFMDACNADQYSLELTNKVLVRLDRGQIDHKNDYLVRNCIYEIEEEILDCIGWGIMEAVKNPRAREQVVNWMIQVKDLYKQFKDFKIIMQSLIIMPKVRPDTSEFIREDIPEK